MAPHHGSTIVENMSVSRGEPLLREIIHEHSDNSLDIG
jgi:hypothetical protein